MKDYNKVTEILKSNLKNRISITKGVIVSFLIAGSLTSFATNDGLEVVDSRYEIGNGAFIKDTTIDETEIILKKTIDETTSEEGVTSIKTGDTVVNLKNLDLQESATIKIENGSQVVLGSETDLEFGAKENWDEDVWITLESTSTKEGDETTTLTNQGTLSLTEGNATIIQAIGDLAKAYNEGTINVVGPAGFGMTAENGGVLENRESGVINVKGAGSEVAVGMVVEQSGNIKNEGKIVLSGDGARGMAVGTEDEDEDEDVVENENNEITTQEDTTTIILADVSATNDGTISGDGKNLVGLTVMKKMGDDKNVLAYNEEDGVIDLSGEDNVGIMIEAYDSDDEDEDEDTPAVNTRTAVKDALLVTNYGTIKMSGKNSEAVRITVGNFVNVGDIILDGTNLTGINASGETVSVENDGRIKLNLYKDGEASNNVAVIAEDNALVSQTGEVWLTDVETTDLTEDQLMAMLFKTDDTGEITDLEKGIIRNKNGEIIVAGGDNIDDIGSDDAFIEKVKKENGGVIKVNEPIKFTGTNFDIVVNRGDKFDDSKFIVTASGNKNFNFSGKIAANTLGLSVEDSNLNIKKGQISVGEKDTDVALKAEKGSVVTMDEAIIHGNIESRNSTFDIKNSTVDGNIAAYENSKISIDASSINGYSKIISGDGTSNVALGTKGEKTAFKGKMKDLNLEAIGNFVLEDGSSLEGVSGTVGQGSQITLKVNEAKENALSNNNGTVTLEDGANLVVETERMNISADGAETISLGTTKLAGENINDKIVATQYIFNVEVMNGEEVVVATPKVSRAGETSETKLTIRYAEIEELAEVDNQYKDIYNAAKDGNLTQLLATNNAENMKQLNKLFEDIRNKNAYVLGEAISRDSMKTWRDTFENNIDFLAKNEFKVKGIVMGDIANNNFSRDYDYRATGLMFMGEYGIDNNTTVGMAAGGGYVHGKLSNSNHNKVSGDSWYLGFFGKKAIDNFTFTGNLGYQYNKLEGKRKVSNALESYSYSDNFGVNGFNLGVAGAYDYKLEQGFVLTPHLSLNMNRIMQGKINEGSGVLAEELGAYNSTILETKAGVEIAKYMNVGNDIKVKLFGDLAYINNAGDTDKDFHGNFTGSTKKFKVNSIKKPDNIGELSVGGKVNYKSIFFDGKVGYNFGGGFEATKVTLGVGYTF
jgi:hypothetical protein